MTYQAMLVDVFADKIDEGGKLKLTEAAQDAMPLPDEADSVWTTYRHALITEVAARLPRQFAQWQQQHAAAVKLAKAGAGGASTRDLVAGLRQLPQFHADVKRYTAHISVSTRPAAWSLSPALGTPAGEPAARLWNEPTSSSLISDCFAVGVATVALTCVYSDIPTMYLRLGCGPR